MGSNQKPDLSELIIYAVFAYAVAHHFAIVYYQWRREWSKKPKSLGGPTTESRPVAAPTPRVVVRWRK